MHKLQIPYEKLLETIQEGIWVIDADSYTTYVNPKMAEIVGYRVEEMIGKNLFEFMDEEEIQNAERKVDDRKSGIAENHESRLKHKDGHDVYVELKTISITDDEGNYNGAIAGLTDITDRKKAEEALKVSEEKLSSLLNNMTDAVWSISWPDFTLIYHSPSLEKLYGRSAQEFYDNPTLFKDVTHPEDQHLTEKAIEQLLEEGHATRECRVVKSDGSIIWINDRSKLIYDESHQPIRVEGVTQNITDRKQAENALRMSEELLARSQQIAHIGSWNLDLRTNHLTWSDEVYRIFGIRPQEFTATYEAFLNAVHPDDRIAVNEDYTSSIREERDEYMIEHRIVRRDTGEVRIVHERCVHERDDAGVIIRSIGMVQDITERKKAEQALQVRERFLARTLQTTIDGFWVIDNQKRIIQVNDAYCTMSGYSREELFSMTINDLEVVETPEDTAARIKQIIESGSDLFETHYRRKDGTIFPLEISVTYLAENGGQFICFCRDITDRKKTEEALKLQSRERAAVDTFTYSVSNDLQAPLRRIGGFSEALQEECPDQLNDQARDYLNRITTQIGSMKKLTDALLQLSRVVSREIDREEVDLSALIRSNLEKLQYQETERQLELVVTPGLIAEGDSELLNLMLANLLDNAWKFTSGEEEARIEFSSTEKDGRTVYYLKDNGVGFDMNHAEKLFVPFHKLHSDNDYPGIGIGLNLVYRIISRHGGEIWAEGEPGRGACFYFALP